MAPETIGLTLMETFFLTRCYKMASLNKVQIIGNLCRDPEIKMTPQGKKVASFSIATNEKYNGQDHPEFHNVVLWEKTAEIAEAHLQKGMSIYLEGKIKTRSWDDKDSGKKVYRTEIVGHMLQMLGGKKAESSNNYNQSTNNDDDLQF